MTRKDFCLIAAAVHSVDNGNSARSNNYEAGVRDGRRAAILSLAKALATTNARFDRARFLSACGTTE